MRIRVCPIVLAVVWLSVGPGAMVAAAGSGEGIFASNRCISCHTLNGTAGKLAKVGGVLDGVGKKRDASWLKSYLQDPVAALPGAQMPKPDLTPADLDSLVAYLVTLK